MIVRTDENTSTNSQTLNPNCTIVYRHRWVPWHGSFLCEKCGEMDRENTSPPQMGCPYREDER